MLNIFKTAMGFGPTLDYSDLKGKNAMILDVRSVGEFQSGHYEGAVNIPLDQISSKVNELKKENRPIITCCMSGARSGSAQRELEAAGLTEVYNGGNWASVGRSFDEA